MELIYLGFNFLYDPLTKGRNDYRNLKKIRKLFSRKSSVFSFLRHKMHKKRDQVFFEECSSLMRIYFFHIFYPRDLYKYINFLILTECINLADFFTIWMVTINTLPLLRKEKLLSSPDYLVRFRQITIQSVLFHIEYDIENYLYFKPAEIRLIENSGNEFE